MTPVSYRMYDQRCVSETEITTLSWRDLAVQHVESSVHVRFWQKAVTERRERNAELQRPRYQDLENRKLMLQVAQINECRLRIEIQRRAAHEKQGAFLASIRRSAATRSPETDLESVVRAS